MIGYKEDTEHSYRTSLLLILFLLLLLVSSKSLASHYPAKNDSHEESMSLSVAYQNAILCNSVSIFHFQKISEYFSQIPGLSLFSIRDRLLDYNRKISLNFILVKKTKLTREPVYPMKQFFHLPDNKDEIPVLS